MYRCILVWIGLISAQSLAAFGDARLITLEELEASALAQNPEMRALEASVEAARGSAVATAAWDNPELSVTPGMKRSAGEEGNESAFRFEAEIVQPFKYPGKRAVEVAMAQRRVQLAEFALESARLQIIRDIRRLFLKRLASEELLRLRHEQLESARLLVEAARQRIEHGYASDFESTRSEADVIAAKKALRDAESEVIGLRASLNLLTGRDPLDDAPITGELAHELPPVSVKKCVETALVENPALRAHGVQLELADLAARAARLERRPDFAVGPSFEYTEDEQIVGIGVSLPLPLWDRKKGIVAAAMAEQQKAWAELAKLRAEVAGLAAEAATRYEGGREALALYTPEFFKRLKAAMTQAEHGLANNTTTLLIYLDAKQSYFDALSGYLEAFSQVADARADLESAMGNSLDQVANQQGKL